MNHSLSQPWWCCGLLLLLIATSLLAVENASAQGLGHETRPKSWKATAALTDVTFTDRQHGWAVGSQGVLLRTDDGGGTWTEAQVAVPEQRGPEMSLAEKFQQIKAKKRVGVDRVSKGSEFSCRFETVCFTDANNGWAAGGYDLPYLDHSRAVIARTLDGGKSWHSLPQLMIGRIEKIDISRLSGWAIGRRDPGTKSSLFFTSDAGNIWSSQKSRSMPDLIDAETAGNRFVGIDHAGQPLHFTTAKSEYSAFIGVKDRVVLADLCMKDAQHGFAVGSAGAVLKTDNGGVSWQPGAEHALLKHFDFRCVDYRSKKVWFAGDPGNVLFSFDPETGEVTARVLPAAAAINSIHFVDDEFGWAVGDFGRIYATTDGGENWRLQRSGSSGTSHVGVMIVCDDGSQLPLELIAKQAGEDGKLIGVLKVESNRDADGNGKGKGNAAKTDAIRLAAERLGAAVVSSVSADDEQERLRRIVRTIRLWKPAMLIGFSKSELRQAIQMAGDQTAFPDQLAAGLQTWRADYVMVADPNGPIQFESNVFMPRIGMLLQDVALPSRMLCGLPVRAKRDGGFLAWQVQGQGSTARLKSVQRSPFSSTTFIRRKQQSLPLGSLSSVARVSQKSNQLKWLLNQNIDNASDWEICKQQIGQLGFQLRATSEGDYLAAVWLTELADQFAAAGHHDRAALALEELVRSYPDHCLAPLASTTLARYYGSTEYGQQAIANWQRIASSSNSSVAQANRIPAGNVPRVAVEQRTLSDGRQEYRWNKVDLASALEEAAALPLQIDIAKELEDFDPATVDLSLDAEPEPAPETLPPKPLVIGQVERDAFQRERLRQAANQFSRLGIRDPSLVKRADFLYLQAHIVKQLSGLEQAKTYYQNVIKADADSAYATAARSILGDDASDSTQVIVSTTRPHLDGLPNDPQWQQAMSRNQVISLTSDRGGLSDIAMVTRDEEFLYLYARCYNSAQVRSRNASAKRSAKRKRDADVSLRDRIKFSFDVDRDLASSWDLQIDHRGEVYESCGSDTSWNPKLFVARHVDDRVWSIECAIRLDDLAKGLGPKERWRWTVERTDSRLSSDFWQFGDVDSGRVLSFPSP